MARTWHSILSKLKTLKRLSIDRQQLANSGIVIAQFLLFPTIAWLLLWGLTQGLTNSELVSTNLLRTFGLPILSLFFAYRLFALIIDRLGGKEVYNILVNRFLFPLFLFYAVLQCLGLLTELSILGDIKLFTIANTGITLRSLMVASVGLYLWFAGVQGLAKLLRKLLLNRMHVDEGALDASLILMRYFLIGLGLFFVFNELNLDSNAIAAISGGLAVGIGFGLRDVVVNFISGIVLLFERSLHPGDVIEIQGQMGRVEEISLRATTVKTNDEVEIVVPNQIFFTKILTSYTRRSRKARFTLTIPIAYDYDPETVIPILLDSVREDANILTSLTSKVEVSNLGQCLIYKLKIWTQDPLSINGLRSKLYRKIWIDLQGHGIEPVSPGEIVIEKQLSILPQGTIAENSNPAIAEQHTTVEVPKNSTQARGIQDSQSASSNKLSQVELVENSFAKIKPYANEFVDSFYQELFRENPKLKVLFKGTDMNKMHKKLLESLVLLVENLRKPMVLRPVLKDLGARHKSYGVIEQYYPAVGTALLTTFQKYIPDDWTPEVRRAWTDTFQAVSQIMVEGADELMD